MISVLTLTYKRHHLLEEAIESFLRQSTTALQSPYYPWEMVVINDNADVDYVFDHPNIRIINHKERFPSIAAKIEWGYKQCKYDYIYRLDDDDLLSPFGLMNATQDIIDNPTFKEYAGVSFPYEIYRSSGMYFFSENKFEGVNSNVNNGNIYTKAYLDRIIFPDKSGNEDVDITFGNNARIYESKRAHTMCYRWGMNTLHISGMGCNDSELIFAQADRVLNNTKGVIELHPQFLNDYYTPIFNYDKSNRTGK